jgi:glutathione S-transferase
VLKIYGRLNSVNVQKVVWCADELGVAYERIEAGGKFGVVGTPEYQAMNPNSLIPVIDDDGFVLWESNAIVRYLACCYGSGTLSPTDFKERANADRWMDWQTTSFNPSIGPAFIQLIRTELDKRDMAVVEAARAQTEKRMAVLDAHLARNEYMTGATFTMGDIPVGASTHRWLNIPVPRESWPNVERWYKQLRLRKGSLKALELPVT